MAISDNKYITDETQSIDALVQECSISIAKDNGDTADLHYVSDMKNRIKQVYMDWVRPIYQQLPCDKCEFMLGS